MNLNMLVYIHQFALHLEKLPILDTTTITNLFSIFYTVVIDGKTILN